MNKSFLVDGWKSMPAKHCVSSRQNGDWGSEPMGENEGHCCLRAADFDYARLGFKAPETFVRREYPKGKFEKVQLVPGDILVEKSGGGEKTPVGRAVMYHGGFDGCFSNFLERIRVDKSVCAPDFFLYWWTACYQTGAFVPYFNQTTGIQNLDSQTLLSENYISLPELAEQQSIADLLNAETAKMDKALYLLEQQVETLERYKKSLIQEIVTKGLESNVPMKPSGVEWIGDIPECWRTNRLRYLADFESGATPSKDDLAYWEGEIPWVSSMEVKSDVIEDTSLHISAAAVASCSTRLLPAGTLVMVVRSGILQHTVPVALLGRPMTINQDIKALQFGPDMTSKYFFYFAKGNNDNLLKALLKDKSTVDNINLEYLKSLVVPVPSISEQREISDYLDAKCSAIDKILAIKREQIEVLRKQRQSLIYEYVTGKRRVPQEANHGE